MYMCFERLNVWWTFEAQRCCSKLDSSRGVSGAQYLTALKQELSEARRLLQNAHHTRGRHTAMAAPWR